MQTIVQRVTLPDDRRILMISDLHGHAKGLEALLSQAHFSHDDVLIIVGDMVEKGPESLRTLRMVMDLTREYTVYPLIGNVDLWRLEGLMSDDPETQKGFLQYSMKAREWWNGSFLDDLCAELGFLPDLATDTQALFPRLRKHFASEFSFIQNLPTVLETQRMIFVHGGIPHERLEELEGQDNYPLLKWDHFWQDGLSFEKYVVVGHWPSTLYRSSHPCYDPLIDHERHILSIDGGCGVKEEGQLNLVMLPSWQSENFTWHSWTDLPLITALESQAPSADSHYIHWGDHEVSLLERNEISARVLHHGDELTVPADFLWEKDGKTYCSDFTDYHLPVEAGERLHLIFSSPMGCYAKKDGVTGWYMGTWTT